MRTPTTSGGVSAASFSEKWTSLKSRYLPRLTRRMRACTAARSVFPGTCPRFPCGSPHQECTSKGGPKWLCFQGDADWPAPNTADIVRSDDISNAMKTSCGGTSCHPNGFIRQRNNITYGDLVRAAFLTGGSMLREGKKFPSKDDCITGQAGVRCTGRPAPPPGGQPPPNRQDLPFFVAATPDRATRNVASGLHGAARRMRIEAPRTVEEMKIARKVLEDLALKTVYLLGEASLHDLAEQLCVGLRIVEDLCQQLRREQLCQATGMSSGVHRLVLTTEGKVRALDALAINQYVGPLPVALDDYVRQVRAQTVRRMTVHPQALEQAFAHLVLEPQVLRQLGSALVSGKALFLYGPSGTGKTTVAETLLRLLEVQHVWVPYAVEHDGQIITIHDPLVHAKVDDPATDDGDARWVLCRRPRVVVGGELTIEMLDLQFNAVTKYYAAPAQLKASNGLLVIDDFGRQRVRAEELLNRWVVPLDRGIDFLTLAGGKKIEIPFDVLVVFATNLDPKELVDEAFLRRIQTKIRLGNVTGAQFHDICRRVCGENKLAYDRTLIDKLIETIASDLGQELRPCYARDIINQVCWTARYEQRPPQLDPDALAHAVRTYFVSAA